MPKVISRPNSDYTLAKNENGCKNCKSCFKCEYDDCILSDEDIVNLLDNAEFCRNRNIEACKKYYEANKEKVKQRNKEYQRNSVKRKKYRSEYRRKNKEKIAAYNKIYRERKRAERIAASAI